MKINFNFEVSKEELEVIFEGIRKCDKEQRKADRERREDRRAEKQKVVDVECKEVH